MFDTKPSREAFQTFVTEAQKIHQAQVETMTYLQKQHEAWVARQPKEDPMLTIVKQNILDIEQMLFILKHALFFAILVLLSVAIVGG